MISSKSGAGIYASGMNEAFIMKAAHPVQHKIRKGIRNANPFFNITNDFVNRVRENGMRSGVKKKTMVVESESFIGVPPENG